MGQAKNRGTREQRIDQARAEREELASRLRLEQRSIGEIKGELGLPDRARFHGYAVHEPAKDEFLFSFTDTNDAITRQWIGDPGLAKCFADFSDAYRLVRLDRGEIVVGVFETETQYFVADVLGE